MLCFWRPLRSQRLEAFLASNSRFKQLLTPKKFKQLKIILMFKFSKACSWDPTPFHAPAAELP